VLTMPASALWLASVCDGSPSHKVGIPIRGVGGYGGPCADIAGALTIAVVRHRAAAPGRSGGERRLVVEPGTGALELFAEAEERGLVAVAGGELDGDGKAARGATEREP
jgi:hypothetical protein